MPELPEVETVRRSLLPLVGRRITSVRVIQPVLRWPLPADFEDRVHRHVIDGIDRLGKYLLFKLSSGDTLLVHLGMSGTLLVRRADVRPRTHDHVVFRLDDGCDLVYHDPRRFGSMRIGRLEDFDVLRRLGTDAMSESLSPGELWALTRGRRRPIKSLLMDQRFLGGLGNIYVNEILFLANVRPGRRASRVTRRDAVALVEAARTVLREAIREGGTSISDHRDGEGRPGYFQLRLRVYGRTGEPCPSCGAKIRRVVHTGRSSFYCPACQR